MIIKEGNLEVTREINTNYIIAIIRSYVHLETGSKVNFVYVVPCCNVRIPENMEMMNFNFIKGGVVIKKVTFSYDVKQNTLYIYRNLN